jgi:hypothetical protein
MDEATLRRPEYLTYGGSLIVSLVCLAGMFFFITGRCGAIFRAGGDCCVGAGWFALAGGFMASIVAGEGGCTGRTGG